VGNDVSIGVAVQQATSAAAWSHMHQNTPLHKLVVDYSSLTEVLRLHLLSSGAKQTQQSKGSVAENDDPGLYMRMDDPQILKTLSTGTVFDLTMSDKLKVIQCLVHQIVSYAAVKDIMEDNFELFKQARVSYRTLVAAEKKRETEDNFWR
jgi:bromodomain adjacent to zinc finger domain protein 1A